MGQAGSRSVKGMAQFCGNDAERLFDLFALGDIHIDSREAPEFTLGVPCGPAQAMHPNHLSIGPDGPELDIPNVIAWGVPDFVDARQHPRTVFRVDARDPGLVPWSLAGNTVHAAVALVPLRLVRPRIPRP